MGNCFKANTKSVTELTDQTIEHLILNTGLDRATIIDWHKNFIVIEIFFKIDFNLINI